MTPHFCYGACPCGWTPQPAEVAPPCEWCDEPILGDLTTCDRHTAPRHRPQPR